MLCGCWYLQKISKFLKLFLCFSRLRLQDLRDTDQNDGLESTVDSFMNDLNARQQESGEAQTPT